MGRAMKMNGPGGSASEKPRGLDPNSRCELCRHPHNNSECYKQHPELAPKSKLKKRRGKKGKAKVSAGNEIFDDKDNSDDDGVSLASVAKISSASLKNKNPLLYDTGASHHFIRVKENFITLKKLSHPFEFDQAIGKSVLTRQGTCRLKVGNISLDLHDSLYSPKSACNIISAVRLKNEHGIVAAAANQLLVKLKDNQPVAQLVTMDGVFYIQPLNHAYEKPASDNKAAPGVARLPRTSSAQRWHQRLGHVGQKILKKTAEYSLGMEGIDISELNTCETCHLSKAQRFVSREPRLTPGEPLDEIFIDTVGKLTKSIVGHQYVVILTDAKTRMRWSIPTTTKDEIAPKLVLWIERQYHQYGKRVRIVFKDGGTEFSRIKEYCEKHGIRTDTSAPYTPEQNGVAEAANKTILRTARSMLIDAGMPPCFWPYAVEHACFVVN
ncbi:hypothetical protein K3495_g15613, partial [Podosphaera aphanis]